MVKLTTEETEFLKHVLPVFNDLGELKIKKILIGGKAISINGIKIGGLIIDKQMGIILQLKPTKNGEKLLLDYTKQFQEPVPFTSNAPSFTLNRLDNQKFLDKLIRETYAELSS